MSTKVWRCGADVGVLFAAVVAMFRRAMSRLLALVAALTFVAAADVRAACTPIPISCNTHPTGRLETSDCRFDGNAPYPYVEYDFNGTAGQRIDVFMTSSVFRPRLQLYRGSTQVAFDEPARTITELRYEIPSNGVYRLIASGELSTNGSFQVDFYCTGTTCVGAFETTPMPFQQTVAAGTSATLTVKPDGTAPFTYRWYEASDPLSTIGGNSPMLVTPPVTQTTRFGVHVSNACGSFDDVTTVLVCDPPKVTVKVTPELVPPGQPATLTATVTGTQPTSYTWYLAADPLTPLGTGPTFTTPPVTTATQYYVRVKSSCGDADSPIVTVLPRSGKSRAVRH